jgi:acetoacetyl-CoA synthetase
MSDSKSRASAGEVIWSPPSDLIASCQLTKFACRLAALSGQEFTNYNQLHKWSVDNLELFWREALSFLEIKGSGVLDPVLMNEGGPTPLARKWFPNFQLNFADNLLSGAPDEEIAVVAWSEERIRRSYTFAKLRDLVMRVRRFLRDEASVKPGDRVFGYLPNIPEAVVAMLGTAKLGATWSSCGTDYQSEGVVARIERVRPKVLVVSAGYLWRGETRSLNDIINQLVNRCTSIKAVLVVDHLGLSDKFRIVSDRSVIIEHFNALQSDDAPWSDGPLFPFSQPLYILFSSGTTGRPKGIVHTAGGTLIEHKKEHLLHSDIRRGDRCFYQTSTSWMMWNWLVSGLASGATILLYEGDAFREDGGILWRLADTERITHFGTSAAYIAELEKRGLEPGQRYKLSDLRAVFSTGSSLSPRLFDYVKSAIKPLWLQSISGGTDIVGCFGLGCPIRPVIRGEVQSKSLGYDVRVFNSEVESVVGEQGELVCASPAPSMPSHFIDDPSGADYQSAYFSDFPGVWRHGDYVLETSEGGLIFSGRSDATLKPGGVRVATADIYAVLQRVADVVQGMAVGYSPPGEGASESIVLFVVLRAGKELTRELEDEIRRELKRDNTFFVPKLIFQAPDLPRTANNKLAELTVKKILRGEDAGNKSALVNPECLGFFEGVARGMGTRFSR